MWLIFTIEKYSTRYSLHDFKYHGLCLHERIDKVFDSVGKDTFENSFKSVSVCGHLINFGQSSGPVEPVSMSSLASKSLTISRPILFDYISNLSIYKKMANSVFNAFKQNQIKTSKLEPYKLEDASLAHDVLESRRGGGSVFLAP